MTCVLFVEGGGGVGGVVFEFVVSEVTCPRRVTIQYSTVRCVVLGCDTLPGGTVPYSSINSIAAVQYSTVRWLFVVSWAHLFDAVRDYVTPSVQPNLAIHTLLFGVLMQRVGVTNDVGRGCLGSWVGVRATKNNSPGCLRQ